MGRKSVHLKLGTGQRNLEEEKSEGVRGPLWLWDFGKLLLACQLVFVAWEGFLGRSTFLFMHGDDIICNWRCLPFRGNSPGAATDNLRENPKEFEENFSNWTLRSECKNGLSRQLPAIKIYFNTSGPPSACVVLETPWPVQAYSCLPPCDFWDFFFFINSLCPQRGHHTVCGTLEVSPPSQQFLTYSYITFNRRFWDVLLHSSTSVFGHTFVSCLQHIRFFFCGSSLTFCWRDYLASAAGLAPQRERAGPQAPRLMAYFWISVWQKGESLPQQEKRSRRGSFAARRPHAKPEAAPSTLPVQTNSRSECFPALNNENKAAYQRSLFTSEVGVLRQINCS